MKQGNAWLVFDGTGEKHDLDDLIEAHLWDSRTAFPTTCAQGCEVESDGTCQHGGKSLLLAAGVI